MSSGDNVNIISPEEKDSEVQRLTEGFLHERKVEIHGACIKLLTNVKQFYEMWTYNFKPISEEIRPHGRIFVINDGGGLKINYETVSKTLMIFNCDYYGLVKSLALALVADFFEEYYSEHRRYSIHGSLIDLRGHGLVIIGPPGSGKTTLTYGMLTNSNYNYVADDWFFVRVFDDGLMGFSSEQNSYIREDLAKIWPSFAKKLEEVSLDSHRRGIVDVPFLFGERRIRESTYIRAIVLLERDKEDKRVFVKLDAEEAVGYTVKNDFFNPHQLVRDSRKISIREGFFKEIYQMLPVYLLNTVELPADSLQHCLKIEI